VRLGITPEEVGEAVLKYRFELTPEELELLKQLAGGLANKQLTSSSGVTGEKSIKSTLHRLYTKLHVRSRSEATRMATEFGIKTVNAFPRASNDSLNYP